ALSRKSGMIAGIKVEEEIIRDLERLDIELYLPQKEDSEIWTIVKNLDEQTEFHLDEDDVLWQGTRLCVPNDATLREALLTEAHSSPFSVHPGLQKAWRTRLKFSTAFHPQKDGQTEHTIQTLEDMLRSCALEWTGNWDDYICLVEFAYNNSWHASIKCALFEMLYGRKCRAPICWDQEKLKEARTRQKSYADKHRRSIEFQPGDRVFLKVSPVCGVRRF
nr:putative nucleotidyltransferase, ribonuclease H [Tanacetum cinerariifolium]